MTNETPSAPSHMPWYVENGFIVDSRGYSLVVSSCGESILHQIVADHNALAGIANPEALVKVAREATAYIENSLCHPNCRSRIFSTEPKLACDCGREAALSSIVELLKSK